MPTDALPIELSVESTCGELVVEASRGSIFHRVRLSVGGEIVKSGFGRVRWRGTPPPRASMDPELTVVATSGDHEARWVAEHASPVPITVTIAPNATAYKLVKVELTADTTCVDPERLWAFQESALVADARSPWHSVHAKVDRTTTAEDTGAPWGAAFWVTWEVRWNGWIVDEGRVEAPLLPPRIDLDGDGRTVREGDADDHDPVVSGMTDIAPSDAHAYPWSAVPLAAGSETVAVTLQPAEEAWYVIDVHDAGPLGTMPLHVTADGPMWAEVWDGGPIKDDGRPSGQLAAMKPMIYVGVGPGRELAPRGADGWSFAIKAGEHPPFLTDDVWKAATKPTKNPLWGALKFAGAVIVSSVTGVLDLTSAIPAVVGAKIEAVPNWSGPVLEAHTRIYLRLTPADATGPHTATITLGAE